MVIFQCIHVSVHPNYQTSLRGSASIHTSGLCTWKHSIISTYFLVRGTNKEAPAAIFLQKKSGGNQTDRILTASIFHLLVWMTIVLQSLIYLCVGHHLLLLFAAV